MRSRATRCCTSANAAAAGQWALHDSGGSARRAAPGGTGSSAGLIAVAGAKRRSRPARHPRRVSAGLRRVCAPFPAHEHAGRHAVPSAPSPRGNSARHSHPPAGIRPIHTYIVLPAQRPGPPRARADVEKAKSLFRYSQPRVPSITPPSRPRSQAISIYYHGTPLGPAPTPPDLARDWRSRMPLRSRRQGRGHEHARRRAKRGSHQTGDSAGPLRHRRPPAQITYST